MKEKRTFAVEILKRAWIGLVVISFFSGLVMLLWNFWVPEILGLKAINFWQAAAMLAISRILFGHFWAGSHHGHQHRHHDFRNNNSIREKWMEMTDEERKEFFNRRREFCRDDFWKRKNNRATPDDAAKEGQ